MVEALARSWGWILLRGIAAILFGFFTLFQPAIALATLVLLFGAYALVDGVSLVVAGITGRESEERWGVLLVGGLLGIAAGIVTFLMPGITALALLAVIAAWAIVVGMAEVVAAIELRRVIRGEWLLVVAGLASVALGGLLVARPAVGALAVALWIGVYALIAGVLRVALALRLRSWVHGLSEAMPPLGRRGAAA